MRVGDIIAAIEQFAPLSIQEGWDNSGLSIGSPEDEVHGVLVGFDCTAELIDEAVAAGCDMVVTHHPLIFKGLKRIQGGDPVSDAVIRAVRAGVAVYAAHTTADKVIAGVSGAMARRLELQDITLMEDEGGFGLGAAGTLPRPMTGEEAIAYVKDKFGLSTVRVSRPVDRVVRVAMCGGSGASEIEAARASGAQLYISGDISYHHFFTPDGFMVMDIGHFESEVDIVGILFKVISEKFPTFAVRISDNLGRSNPVRYY
ncbi:MAG: Nif3-like dinuclear metal center hexameric protein [Bacteroidales bacterium]|nr:Nif3-like dinuclear metal center hexameric protein [Bacteroidales bacterium]